MKWAIIKTSLSSFADKPEAKSSLFKWRPEAAHNFSRINIVGWNLLSSVLGGEQKICPALSFKIMEFWKTTKKLKEKL